MESLDIIRMFLNLPSDSSIYETEEENIIGVQTDSDLDEQDNVISKWNDDGETIYLYQIDEQDINEYKKMVKGDFNSLEEKTKKNFVFISPKSS